MMSILNSQEEKQVVHDEKIQKCIERYHVDELFEKLGGYKPGPEQTGIKWPPGLQVWFESFYNF